MYLKKKRRMWVWICRYRQQWAPLFAPNQSEVHQGPKNHEANPLWLLEEDREGPSYPHEWGGEWDEEDSRVLCMRGQEDENEVGDARISPQGRTGDKTSLVAMLYMLVGVAMVIPVVFRILNKRLNTLELYQRKGACMRASVSDLKCVCCLCRRRPVQRWR